MRRLLALMLMMPRRIHCRKLKTILQILPNLNTNMWRHKSKCCWSVDAEPTQGFLFINIHLWVFCSISKMRLMHLSNVSNLSSISIDKSVLFTALTLQQHIFYISSSLPMRRPPVWFRHDSWSHVTLSIGTFSDHLMEANESQPALQVLWEPSFRLH